MCLAVCIAIPGTASNEPINGELVVRRMALGAANSEFLRDDLTASNELLLGSELVGRRSAPNAARLAAA